MRWYKMRRERWMRMYLWAWRDQYARKDSKHSHERARVGDVTMAVDSENEA